MLKLIKTILLISLFPIGVNADQLQDATTEAARDPLLTVYKSPTCGCCGAWVDHLKNAGVEVSTVEDADMASIKNRFDLPIEARSCHTAVQGDYFFEGHVPPALVQSFILNPPDGAKGLVVPGMPIGSAGMEDGNRFQPYKVWLMRDNGEFEEYASIDTYSEQF